MNIEDYHKMRYENFRKNCGLSPTIIVRKREQIREWIHLLLPPVVFLAILTALVVLSHK